MFHLFTTHGTLVFVDEASGQLRHAPIAAAPANLVAERQGDTVVLTYLAPDGGRQGIALGLERCGPAAVAPRRLQERRQGGARCCLFADGRFLSARQGGEVTLSVTLGLEWEAFLFLTVAQHADLRCLMTERWVSASRQLVLAPEDCLCLPSFRVRVGQSDLALEALLEQLSPPGAAVLSERGELTLRTEGWRLDRLHLFRPLLYMTVFGSEAAFSCAWLTISSLLRFGGWQGDILLITDPVHADLAKHLPPEFQRRFHVAAVQADDAMDRAFARYRIAELPVAATFQPILFVDSGTVCDAPLSGLLTGLATSQRLHAGPERALLSEDDAYGRTLFLRDGYADQGGAVGFSTGVLGFRSVRDIGGLFARIVDCGYGFAEREQNREFFASRDQAIANYVLAKEGVFDLSLIYAHRSVPGTAGARKGLLRFVAPDAGEEALLGGMRDYVAQISREAE